MGLIYIQSDGSLLDIKTGKNTDSSDIGWATGEPSVTGCVYYKIAAGGYLTTDVCSYGIPAVCVA